MIFPLFSMFFGLLFHQIRAWRRALDPTTSFRLTLMQLRKFFHYEASLRDCEGLINKTK